MAAQKSALDSIGDNLATSPPAKALMQASQYKYEALPRGQFIRILTLSPGIGHDALEAKLEPFDITTPADYETLSYAWGDLERCQEIICGNRSLKITTSLHSALRRLRHGDRPRRLWADQACINQDDKDERSQQVQFMNQIFKNSKHVLVWLGSDHEAMAKHAFAQIHELYETFKDEGKCSKFRTDYVDHLEKCSEEPWIPLRRVTHLPWFTRVWIVQEIGTKAPATLFWGEEEIDWKVLHSVCDDLTEYHHLRKQFQIRTDMVKYIFRRFIEPSTTSRHANRFSLMYELHRARHLKVTDKRDRVFAMLGHFSLRMGNEKLAALQADYKKTTAEVYVDVAIRALTGDSSLITLAAVQHPHLPSSTLTPNEASTATRPVDKNTLPSWVPNWETFETHILSEPISPHCANGTTPPTLQIDESTLLLSAHGIKIDVIVACSQPLAEREFHLHSSKRTLAIETLWRDICGKGPFTLEERYVNGDSAFLAYTQTLSNGCVATSLRESRSYPEIHESEWLAEGAAYLTKALGNSKDIVPALYEKASGGDHYKWSRAANGASSNRCFARTANGYFVLGPKVLEVGDVVCVLFGGKMPFCLRPWGRHYLLVGESYVHGLMRGEAIEMLKRGEVAEESFGII